MTRWVHILLMLLMPALAAPLAAQTFFDSPSLSDDELADTRGGFDLANGVKVDFGVLITTSIDGAPILRTDYQVTGNDVRMSVQTPSGGATGGEAHPADVTVTVDRNGLSAAASMPQLLVRHEVGQQISSLIVNTADGRTVDSQLTVNMRLDNVQPLALGSAGFRVQSLGMDAALWRGMGG